MLRLTSLDDFYLFTYKWIHACYFLQNYTITFESNNLKFHTYLNMGQSQDMRSLSRQNKKFDTHALHLDFLPFLSKLKLYALLNCQQHPKQ